MILRKAMRLNAPSGTRRPAASCVLALLGLLALTACAKPHVSGYGPRGPYRAAPERRVEARAQAAPQAPAQRRYAPKDAHDQALAILRTARGQIGVRYRYGGASPGEGFDCSGLIYWAYRQHGVAVPRMARVQSGYGGAVRQAQLRPGDIVAFRIGRAYHTGIYSGDGRFIHSPSKGQKVREESMRTRYWQRHYIGARRVL